jgi:hypothetical protein
MVEPFNVVGWADDLFDGFTKTAIRGELVMVLHGLLVSFGVDTAVKMFLEEASFEMRFQNDSGQGAVDNWILGVVLARKNLHDRRIVTSRLFEHFACLCRALTIDGACFGNVFALTRSISEAVRDIGRAAKLTIVTGVEWEWVITKAAKLGL